MVTGEADIVKYRMRAKQLIEKRATSSQFHRMVDVSDSTIPKSVLVSKENAINDIVKEYSTFTVEKGEEIRLHI